MQRLFISTCLHLYIYIHEYIRIHTAVVKDMHEAFLTTTYLLEEQMIQLNITEQVTYFTAHNEE